MVRDLAGKRVAASQVGRPRVIAGVRPLTLLKAPHGAGAVSSASVGRAYAGAFSDLRATGAVSARGLLLRVTHRFTRDWIQTSWTASRAPAALGTPRTCCSRAGPAILGLGRRGAARRDAGDRRLAG